MSFKAEPSLMESVSKGRRHQVLEDDGLGILSLYKRYDTVDLLILHRLRQSHIDSLQPLHLLILHNSHNA